MVRLPFHKSTLMGVITINTSSNLTDELDLTTVKYLISIKFTISGIAEKSEDGEFFVL